MNPRKLMWLVVALVVAGLLAGGLALVAGGFVVQHREQVARQAAELQAKLEAQRETAAAALAEAEAEKARLAAELVALRATSEDHTRIFGEAGGSARRGAPEWGAFDGTTSASLANVALPVNPAQPVVEPTATPTPTPTPALGSMAVLVTDQLGNPLGDFTAVLSVPLPDAAPGTALVEVARATTSSAGIASFPALYVADYTLAVTTPLSWLERAEQKRAVAITAGKLTEESFTFASEDSMGVVVLDFEDNPIAGATVSATIAGVVRPPLETDADGMAMIAAIPHGAMVDALRVGHPDHAAQTRRELRVFDGTQTFRLEPRGDITLLAVWAADRKPVEAYTYRLLRRTDGGIFGLTPSSSPVDVRSEDGTAVLTGNHNMDAATWRVEVVVGLGAAGMRGSATFDVTPTGEAKDVLVEVGGGTTLRGRVARNGAGGEGVDGSRVMITPPHQAFRQHVDDERFLLEPVVADGEGNFAFERVPPGQYALVAVAGSSRTEAPVDVVVAEDGSTNPSFVELVIKDGGVIYGTAVGPGRKPIVEATVRLRVQNPNADGWSDGPTGMTNDSGEYRIEGIPAGAHYVGLGVPEEVKGIGSVPWSVINVVAGQETRHDFDLSGDVTVRGRVTLSGGAVAGRLNYVMFANEQVRSAWAPIDAEGRYELVVAPGSYSVRTAGALVLHGESDGHVVADSPAEQTIDLDFAIVATDIVVVFPDNLPLSRGQVVLMPEDAGIRYNIPRIKFEQENRHVATLIAGRYQATFTSFDKQWRGETEWTMVGQNAARELVIDVYRTVEGVRIGGWAPGQLNNAEWRTLTFDITEAVAGASGTASVLATYEKGRHAVELRSARLLVDGRVAAQDIHAGWTGSDHWGNRFRLALGEARAGARYAVELDLKPDGGNDTTGSVYLSVK